MKLLLTSAGITNGAIADALAELAGRPLTELSIIHIPTAANTEGGDKGWVINDLVNLQKQQFKSVDILDVAAVGPEIWHPRLAAADIICFGGGNEQYLAKVCKEIGMKDFLLSIMEKKVYMGISAGSMVAGKYLPHELSAVLYPEEDFHDTAEQPMELYGFCFIPHLDSEWFAHVRTETLAGMKSRFAHPVYSTDDQTAVALHDGSLKIVGSGAHWTSAD